MGYIKTLLIVSLLFLSNAAIAATHILCIPVTVKVDNKNMVLSGVDQPGTKKLYFLHNTSTQSLWIDHPMERRSASAGWSSYLRPGNWSILMLNRKNFSLNCAVIRPGAVDYKNCTQVISVCIPQHINLNVKREGSYWVVEDKSWDDLLKIVEKKIEEPPKSVSHDGKIG